MTNPYAAPTTEIVRDLEALARARRGVAIAFAALLASAAVFAGAIAIAMKADKPGATIAFAAASLVGLVATWRAVKAMRVALHVSGSSAWLVAGGLLAASLNLGLMALGAFAAWLSTVEFTRGRQLRSFGRVLLPPVARGEAWAARAEAIAVDASVRAEVAARWRENGRTEHASVAAFARLTLDLMALGAPPALIAAAQRDALDEIAHTEACFAIARAIDDRADSPGAFPRASRARTLPRSRTLALSLLAVDSLIDGALHEGVSARIVAKLARRCEEPSIRATLRRIAADEGRHAAHGWDVVRWCVEQGGRPVASALAGALLTLPTQMVSPMPAPAAQGAWEKWGLHGQPLEAQEYASTRAQLMQRTAQLTTRASRAA